MLKGYWVIIILYIKSLHTPILKQKFRRHDNKENIFKLIEEKFEITSTSKKKFIFNVNKSTFIQ